MGRKNKSATPENQESCQKLNFLHQASHAVLAINPENIEMSRFLASTMKAVAEKVVFKLDPSIKRTTCKHCHALLIPGVTARVRVRRKRERHIVVTCLDCRMVRRYLCRPDYVLWSERKVNNAQEDERDKNTMQEHQKQEQGKS